MESINEQMPLLQSFMDMLEGHFGDELEIVLHDLTLNYEHTIVDIRNSHITGREIGDCGDNLGLEVIRGTIADGNRYNYVNHTKDGKILRSSSLFIRNGEGKVIGSICINQDITKAVEFEKHLAKRNQYQIQHNDMFTKDVGNLLDELINMACLHVGKHCDAMRKEDKIRFLEFLDERGAFLISKSTTRICKYLKISKYTLYNYLESIRQENGKGPDGSGPDKEDAAAG